MTVITHDANISITHDANLTITLQSDIHDVYNIRHDIQNSVIQIILTRLSCYGVSCTNEDLSHVLNLT